MTVNLNKLREIAPDVAAWMGSYDTVESANREWLRVNGIFDTDDNDEEATRLLNGLDAIRAASDTPSEWWCPNCKCVVDWQNVTFEERHDACGCAVEAAPTGEPSYSLRVAAEALLEAYRQATCDVEEMPAEMFEAFTEVRNLRAALEEVEK
jgi:hypothetical protein